MILLSIDQQNELLYVDKDNVVTFSKKFNC